MSMKRSWASGIIKPFSLNTSQRLSRHWRSPLGSSAVGLYLEIEMEFQVTFDYLCPFARNANEAVLNGLAAGREWKVIFRPFSLAQVHREEGEEDAYDDRSASGVLALQWGIAARDFDPDNFFPVHRALFAARHDRNLDIRDENVL